MDLADCVAIMRYLLSKKLDLPLLGQVLTSYVCTPLGSFWATQVLHNHIKIKLKLD
jgi:hypothetical protein